MAVLSSLEISAQVGQQLSLEQGVCTGIIEGLNIHVEKGVEYVTGLRLSFEKEKEQATYVTMDHDFKIPRSSCEIGDQVEISGLIAHKPVGQIFKVYNLKIISSS